MLLYNTLRNHVSESGGQGIRTLNPLRGTCTPNRPLAIRIPSEVVLCHAFASLLLAPPPRSVPLFVFNLARMLTTYITVLLVIATRCSFIYRRARHGLYIPLLPPEGTANSLLSSNSVNSQPV